MNPELLRKLVRRTPLLQLEEKLFGKAENLQTGGSYKIRGVAQALASTPAEALNRGLSTVSAGNLGQSLAIAAAKIGAPCRIYVPDSAPEVKKRKILELGAELVPLPFEAIWKIVRGELPETRSTFLHPCFNEQLHRGYGTIAQEIMEDLPEADTFVVPYGLGGLFLGMANALQRLKPAAEIYACEIATAAPLRRALDRSPKQGSFRRSAVVDAIGTPELVPEIFAQIAPLLSDSIVVSEAETLRALRVLYEYGLVVEGAAAVAFAAAQHLSRLHPGRKIACVLSGGNIQADPFGC
jgi:threonine dehydratase